MESSSELSGNSDSENYRETELQPGEDSEKHSESIKRSEDVANPSQAGVRKCFRVRVNEQDATYAGKRCCIET